MANTGARDDGPRPDGGEALSAGESLAVINEQRATVSRALDREPAGLYLMWAGLWLAVFALAFLGTRGDLPVPGWVAGIAGGVLVLTGVIVSAVVGIRMGNGIRGPSSTTGALYGWSWTLGFAALVGVNQGLMGAGVPDELMPLLWSGSAMTLAGVLCLAGGVVFRDIPQYALGVWFLLVAVACVLAGTPANFLVVGIGGAAGFAGRALLMPQLLGRPRSPAV